MARGKTLQEIADEQGIPLETLIENALMESEGNIFQAARLLGKYPNTIYNFLKTHPEFRLEIKTETTARLVRVTSEADHEPA